MKSHPVNKAVNVICDHCGNGFSSSSIELAVRDRENGMQEQYYNCPICGKEYVVIKTDQEIRDLMKARDSVKGYALHPEAPNMKSLFESLDKQIKEKLSKLNNK